MVDYAQVIDNKLKEFDSSILHIERLETDLTLMYIQFETKFSDINQVDSLIKDKLKECGLLKGGSEISPCADGFYSGHIWYYVETICLSDLSDLWHISHCPNCKVTA